MKRFQRIGILAAALALAFASLAVAQDNKRIDPGAMRVDGLTPNFNGTTTPST